MKLSVFLFVFFFSLTFYSQSFKVDSFFSESQQNGTIKGFVLDEENNNEPLVFAEIIVKNSETKTESAIDGSFHLNLKQGIYNLQMRFIGYKTIEINNIKVTSNNTTNLNQTLAALKIEPSISIASVE